jgi:molybdate transport system substrate-binding protein
MPRFIACLFAFVLMSHAAAAQPVQLYSAGSLKGAWLEAIGVFGVATGITVEPRFGPSGALKDQIVAGAKADVFTSANMEHPQALAAAHLSGPVIAFAGNRLCAMARPGLDVTPATLLDRMLDPAVKLATSTPKADPAGDYAWQVFHKADAVRPGAFAQLDNKALQLVGRPFSPIPVDNRSAYGALLAQGAADLFLAYCTAGRVAQAENPALQMIALPPELAVGADYGLTVLNGAPPDAYKFAMFILSPDGQAILTKAGFGTLMLP